MWTPEATDKADDKHLIHGKHKKSMGGWNYGSIFISLGVPCGL